MLFSGIAAAVGIGVAGVAGGAPLPVATGAERRDKRTAAMMSTAMRTTPAAVSQLRPFSPEPVEPCLYAHAETSAALRDSRGLPCRDLPPQCAPRVSPRIRPNRAGGVSNDRIVPSLRPCVWTPGCGRHRHNPSPAARY